MSIARLRDQQARGPRWVSHILQRLVFEMWYAPETARIIEEAAKTYAARREKRIACVAEHGLAAFGVSGVNVWVAVDREAEAEHGQLAQGWAIQGGEGYGLQKGGAACGAGVGLY